LPISYKDDRSVVERIMLEAASRETIEIGEIAAPTLKILEEKFAIKPGDIRPRVFMRLTDNWVELSVRFLCSNHDIRGLKDRMSREIIQNLDKAEIGIASSTYDIVGLPVIRVQLEASADLHQRTLRETVSNTQGKL
jgi:hypothetical protein